MFVRNDSAFQPALARGLVSDEVAVATITVECMFQITRAGLAPIPLAPRTPLDAPDVSKHVLWRGTSVTASGHVYGPRTEPCVRPISLRVGDRVENIAVFGERRWRRSFWGTLEPTLPMPFERIALSYECAFGGSYVESPGLFLGTNLPHPGGTIAHPLNPKGIGLYRDAKSAAGQLLPFIERSDELVREWNQRPRPAGLSPCPELMSLRAPTTEAQLRGEPIAPALRVAHHAPGWLIFDRLAFGTRVSLVGVGKEPLAFEIPMPSFDVEAQSSHACRATRNVRSVHIDADAQTMRVAHAYSFIYEPKHAPRLFVVRDSTLQERSCPQISIPMPA